MAASLRVLSVFLGLPQKRHLHHLRTGRAPLPINYAEAAAHTAGHGARTLV